MTHSHTPDDDGAPEESELREGCAMSGEGNTMEPIDRIRAAIAKLEDVREHSTQGDWYAGGIYVRSRITEDDQVHDIPVAQMDVAADDATRIVMLANRNVLNVQLAILTGGADIITAGRELSRFDLILNLADAINGT